MCVHSVQTPSRIICRKRTQFFATIYISYILYEILTHFRRCNFTAVCTFAKKINKENYKEKPLICVVKSTAEIKFSFPALFINTSVQMKKSETKES